MISIIFTVSYLYYTIRLCRDLGNILLVTIDILKNPYTLSSSYHWLNKLYIRYQISRHYWTYIISTLYDFYILYLTYQLPLYDWIYPLVRTSYLWYLKYLLSLSSYPCIRESLPLELPMTIWIFPLTLSSVTYDFYNLFSIRSLVFTIFIL